MGFPANIVKFSLAYLSNCKFKVVINGRSSDLKGASNGFPEGSLQERLILLTIFVSNISQLDFNRSEMFADDTSVIVISSSTYPSIAIARMQTHLNALGEYITLWKMRVNASKIEFMVFTRKRHRMTDAQIFYADAPIRRVDEKKDVCFKIDERVNFWRHVSMSWDWRRQVTFYVGCIHYWRLAVEWVSRTKSLFTRSSKGQYWPNGITVWRTTTTSNKNICKILEVQNKFIRSAQWRN